MILCIFLAVHVSWDCIQEVTLNALVHGILLATMTQVFSINTGHLIVY